MTGRTYHNAYRILSDVREDINDFSTDKVQGSDTSGVFQNNQLMKKINDAQHLLYAYLITRIKEEFLVKADASVVDSEYSLPWNFGRLEVFKDDDKRKVFRVDPQQLHVANSEGFRRFYYQKGRSYILDRDSVTATFEIWYYKRCRELDMGTCSAGAATSITLASTAKKIADYYNGMTIENITKDWVDTIDDYSAARVATISETAASSDYYGIVSELPETFHHLIHPLAVILLKNSSPLVMEKPSKRETDAFNELLRSELLAFAGSSFDVDIEELFIDFDPVTPTGIGII